MNAKHLDLQASNSPEPRASRSSRSIASQANLTCTTDMRSFARPTMRSVSGDRGCQILREAETTGNIGCSASRTMRSGLPRPTDRGDTALGGLVGPNPADGVLAVILRVAGAPSDDLPPKTSPTNAEPSSSPGYRLTRRPQSADETTPGGRTLRPAAGREPSLRSA